VPELPPLAIDIHLSGSLLRGAGKRTLLAELTDGSVEDLGVPSDRPADLALQREFVRRCDLAIALDATSAIPTIFRWCVRAPAGRRLW
jgi:hypothetical protein